MLTGRKPTDQSLFLPVVSLQLIFSPSLTTMPCSPVETAILVMAGYASSCQTVPLMTSVLMTGIVMIRTHRMDRTEARRSLHCSLSGKAFSPVGRTLNSIMTSPNLTPNLVRLVFRGSSALDKQSHTAVIQL